MNKYTKESLKLKDIFAKKVEIDFTAGLSSSDAGVVILRQIDNELGLIDRVCGVIADTRHPSYVQHDLVSLYRQRVFQIACGYEDGNDSNTLRDDPMFKLACDRLPESGESLASQPTISRFENTPSRRDLYRIGLCLVDAFIDSYHSPPEAIVLDIDDTDDPTHGNQQLRLFNGYYGTHCYQPIHIYEGHSGKLITTVLRPGKTPSGKEIVSIIRRIVQRIREVYPDVLILLRGDSHYAAPEVYDFCEAHNIKFIQGLKANTILLQKAKSIRQRAKELFELKQTPVKIYTEFHYQANSWSIPHRVIVKAEYNQKGSNTRFIVTNLQHQNRKFLYEGVYCDRGNMELFIKAHKTHLASDRTSCSTFEANQFRVFLHSLAYILLQTLREKHLKYTNFAKAQFDTIKLKLLKVAANVRELKTKVKISLPKAYPFKRDFIEIGRSCYATGYG